MDEQQRVRVKSANIIQRAFRLYRHKKIGDTKNNKTIPKESPESSAQSETEKKPSSTDHEFEEKMIEEDIHQLQLFTVRVIDQVNSFYKKYKANISKTKTINQMFEQINDITLKLKSVSKLNDLKELPSSNRNSSEEIVEKAKKNHKEQLKRTDSKRWWERIHLN